MLALASRRAGVRREALGECRGISIFFDHVSHEKDPALQIEVLREWETSFPNSEYQPERLALFINAYKTTGRPVDAFARATQLLKLEPESLTGLGMIAALAPSLETPSPDQIKITEDAANRLLARAAEIGRVATARSAGGGGHHSATGQRRRDAACGRFATPVARGVAPQQADSHRGRRRKRNQNRGREGAGLGEDASLISRPPFSPKPESCAAPESGSTDRRPHPASRKAFPPTVRR